MKQRLIALTALILTLCVLCGCSNLSGEAIVEFITGNKPVVEDPEEAPEQEEEPKKELENPAEIK